MRYFEKEFFCDHCLPLADNIPFAGLLNKLFFAPAKDNLDFPIHGPNVIRFATTLLDGLDGNVPHGLLSGANASEVEQIKSRFARCYEEIAAAMGARGGHAALEKAQEFLQICALYHDLGKVIRRANHPQIGTNLLRHFQEDEARALIKALASQRDGRSGAEKAENRFARLASVIQHHDKFGVVATGEGGLPIFSDLLYFRSDSTKLSGIKKNITTVMLLNLADIAAVNTASSQAREKSNQLVRAIGEARARQDWSAVDALERELVDLCSVPAHCKGLTWQIMDDVLGDWKILIDTVQDPGVGGDRGQLKKRLLEIEQNPARALDRLLRLLRAAAGASGAGVLEKQFSLTSVESVLVGALGAYQMQSFCDQFATVVKLDYGLGFFRALVCGCVRRRLDKASQTAPLRSLTEEETDELVSLSEYAQREIAQMATERVIQVIKGLLGRYQGVLGSFFGTGRRFGIQMQTLSGDETVLRTILDFLCFKDKEFIAVPWIADEVSIWSLD